MSFEQYSLANGVRVVMVPMEGVQSTAIGVYVGTGSRYESTRINGISHFLEHMVFKGTKKYPSHTETSYLEGLGAIQNAWTDVDATAYWCKVPHNRWSEGLELVKELALNPTLPANDLEIERGVILEEINRREDRPDEIVSEDLYQLLFGQNSLGMTVLGPAENIKQISRQDFLDYHQSQYVAKNIVVVLAGKISDMATVRSVIGDWFLGARDGEPGGFAPVEVNQTGPEILVHEKDLAQQVHIEIGLRGLTSKDPRRFALGILTSYLGSGLSSRLFLELREKRGLCYAVHASEERYPDTGIWGVYAGLNIEKLEDAIVAILAELKRMKTEKLTQSELDAAREKLRGPMLFSMENPINQMNFYAKQVLDTPEEVLTYSQIEEGMNKVTVDDIQNIAKDIFVTQNLNLAVVGPVNKDRAKSLRSLLSLD